MSGICCSMKSLHARCLSSVGAVLLHWCAWFSFVYVWWWWWCACDTRGCRLLEEEGDALREDMMESIRQYWNNMKWQNVRAHGLPPPPSGKGARCCDVCGVCASYLMRVFGPSKLATLVARPQISRGLL